MEIQEFEAELIQPEGIGTWTYVDVPQSVSDLFGKKGQVKVKGTVNGFPLNSTLMPHGNGLHFLVINRTLRDQVGITKGDRVKVAIQMDLEPRTLVMPGDLVSMFEINSEAKNKFEALSYSHRKEYIDWIEGAKQEITRQKRLKKTIEMLLKNEILKK